MPPLESYGLLDYYEGKDFVVEMTRDIKAYEDDFEIRHDIYFRDLERNLLGYVRLFVEKKDNARKTGKTVSAYILDTISSSAYEKHFSQTRKKHFLENGYTPGVYLGGFGPTMMTYALSYIKENYPEVYQVLVASNDTKGNRQAVWDVSSKVQQKTHNLIERLNGGGEMSTVTIRFTQ